MSDGDENPLLAAIDRIGRPPLVTALAGALLFAMTALMLPHALMLDLDGPGGVAQMGDFLAFYTGAHLIASGQGAALYDLSVQAELQGAMPANEPVWLPYVNPPLLGLVLAPVSGLGIVRCYQLFCGLSALCFATAAWASAPGLPALTSTRQRAATTLLLVLAFFPVLETMLRGQNSILTLSLLAGAWAAHRADRPVLLGLMLGGLTFKPQFGILIGLVVVLRREWTAVAVAAVCSALHYLAGAWLAGWGWPVDLATAIAAIESGQPMHTDTSIRGALVYALPEGVAGPLGAVLAGALALAGAIVGVRMDRGTARFDVGWAFLLVATVLSSPHVQYYDVAVLVLPAVLVANHRVAVDGVLSPWERLGLVSAWIVYPAARAAEGLGFQPLFPLELLLLGWVGWALWRAPDEPATC